MKKLDHHLELWPREALVLAFQIKWECEETIPMEEHPDTWGPGTTELSQEDFSAEALQLQGESILAKIFLQLLLFSSSLLFFISS